MTAALKADEWLKRGLSQITILRPHLYSLLTGTVLSLEVWTQKRDLPQSTSWAPADDTSALYGLEVSAGPEKVVTRKCV